MTIRLAHVWSHDVGIPASIPFCLPLLDRGWQVTFICPVGENAPLADRHGMPVLPLALRRKLHPASDLAGAVQLVRYFAGGKVDIVHTHNIKVGHMARVLAYATRVPIVVHTLHGLAYSLDTPRLRRAGHTLLERMASLRVDAVLAQSDEDQRTVIESGAVPAARVVLVGNGIDLGRYRPDAVTDEERRKTRAELGVAGDEVLFLSAGRLVREKGFDELFRGAEIARRADRRVRLAVAGDIDAEKADALGPAALEAARRAGVLILGRRADMPRLYAAADAIALVSWREGRPRVLMEGAAMARPLLASDARGCRELVNPPRNGLLVPVRDEGAIARAMLAMTADPERRAAWGAENAREARERYDLGAVVARVLAVYDRLLREKGLA